MSVSDWNYYYFMNMDSAIKQGMLKGNIPFYQFRYLKDFVNTKIGQHWYDNLPKPLTSEIMETSLMFLNCLCFYESKELGGWYLCRYLPNSNFGIYWKPDYVDIQTISGKTIAYHVPYEDIILVRDNKMDIPPFLVMMEFFQKIQHCEDDLFKIMDIACLPVAIIGNKKQAGSLQRTAQALGNKNPFIVGDDKMIDQVQSFNIDLPITCKEVYDIRQKYIEELKANMGISATEEKRERLVLEEVTSQNEYTDFIYMEACEERHKAVEELNRRSGLNVVVHDIYTEHKAMEDELEVSKEADMAQADADAEIEVEKVKGEYGNDNHTEDD